MTKYLVSDEELESLVVTGRMYPEAKKIIKARSRREGIWLTPEDVEDAVRRNTTGDCGVNYTDLINDLFGEES